MNVADYLIVQTQLPWARLLADWMPPLPERSSVWLVNRLGEAFAVDANGAVLRLDVGTGACAQVATSQDHFAKLLDGGRAEEWLRIRLVDDCRRAGLVLKPLECYGFKIAPTLGGRYEASNLIPTHLAIHYSYQSYIVRQQDVYWVPPA